MRFDETFETIFKVLKLRFMNFKVFKAGLKSKIKKKIW